jgi:formylglycine-generating enzyme required for sulfatase activity
MFAGADARKLLIGLADRIRAYPDQDFSVGAFGILARALLDLREYRVPRLEETFEKVQPDFLNIIEDQKQPGESKNRILIAEALGQVKDPRLQDSNHWVHIPAGPYWRGSKSADASDDERYEASVEISEFYIQRWPVTVGEYRRFLESTGAYQDKRYWDGEVWDFFQSEHINSPEWWDWQIEKASNYPVVGISWWEAAKYCEWFSTVKNGLPENYVVRLPTEAEWEKSARGGSTLADGSPNPEPKRELPWSGNWHQNHFYSGMTNWIGETNPVGCFPLGNGPYGVWDQIGNVWEWCLDWYAPRAYYLDRVVDPIMLNASEIPLIATLNYRGDRVTAQCKVSKCGTWSTDLRNLRVSHRNRVEPSRRLDDLGFRCVAVPAERARQQS